MIICEKIPASTAVHVIHYFISSLLFFIHFPLFHEDAYINSLLLCAFSGSVGMVMGIFISVFTVNLVT
jgi:hypothetical protein